MNINFFTEGTNYAIKDKRAIRNLINEVILKEKKQLVNINFIITDDENMLKINEEYLHHDTYTDTITFFYNEKKKEVNGDIYISIDRIRENAKTYKTSIQKELVSVMIHGTLHLCGYEDKAEEDKKNKMIIKQEKYLESYN